MPRIQTKLSDLHWNPFKKSVQPTLDKKVVQELKSSIETTSLWEQWVVRKNKDGDLELAFGHHRLQAAIELFGKSKEVSVQLERYDDATMLKAMANENGSDEAVDLKTKIATLKYV